MQNDYAEVVNLLYQYVRAIDRGSFQDAANLFQHGRVKFAPWPQNGVSHRVALRMWRQLVKIYPCGTPLTKHLINNPIVQFADDGLSAHCRSHYTVMQATPKLPLQIIVTGQYESTFHKIGGKWHFKTHEYLPFDLVGNISEHVNFHHILQSKFLQRFQKN